MAMTPVLDVVVEGQLLQVRMERQSVTLKLLPLLGPTHSPVHWAWLT